LWSTWKEITEVFLKWRYIINFIFENIFEIALLKLEF
jgi:hypothetical protein